MTRDRFTRQAIETEFVSDPRAKPSPSIQAGRSSQRSVEQPVFGDLAPRGYWQAVVKAVVPLTNVEKTGRPQEYVQRAVAPNPKG
jgi:hypothetical protein